MSRRAARAILDALAILALVGLALVGLLTTFDSWGYQAVGLVATAIGLVVVVATLRLPVLVLIVVAPAVALVTAGPVAMRSGGLGGAAPGPQTLADVMRGTWSGWGELLTTLPWVDLAGAPALVPFLLGYFAAVVGGGLALRTQRVAAPVLSLLAVLAAVLLLRRPGGSGSELLDWYPVAFAVVAVSWTVLRGLRTSPGASVHGASRGRVTRGVTALVVLAGALLIAVPLSGSTAPGGATLRGRSNALPDLTGLDSPLRRFRTFTEQWQSSPGSVYDRVLFTVSGAPRGSRVRLVTLDSFDGNQWLPANDSVLGTDIDSFQRLDTRVDNPLRGRVVRAQVGIRRPYASVWAPTIGSLTSFQMLYADPGGRRSELRYNLATSTAVLPTGLTRLDPYEFTSVLRPDGLTEQTPRWEGPGLASVENDPRILAFMPKVLFARIPPMQKVFILAHWLRDQGRYSDGALPGEQQYQAGHGADRVIDDFLLTPRPVGNDEQYASAMALLANRVGVPARVVVGAVLPRDGKVWGKDIHAWVEVRVRDGSWRTLPTREFMGNTPPGAVPSAAAPPLLPPGTPEPESAQSQQEPTTDKDTEPQSGQERGARFLRSAPWLLLVFTLTLVLPAVKAIRRRRRRTRGRASDQMAGAWAELIDHARDLGIPVPQHASRPAQARVLATAGALSERGDDGVFGVEEPDPGEVAEYWEQVMGERRLLGRQLPLPRRLWAPFNPVTLLRRPGAD